MGVVEVKDLPHSASKAKLGCCRYHTFYFFSLFVIDSG